VPLPPPRPSLVLTAGADVVTLFSDSLRSANRSIAAVNESRVVVSQITPRLSPNFVAHAIEAWHACQGFIPLCLEMTSLQASATVTRIPRAQHQQNQSPRSHGTGGAGPGNSPSVYAGRPKNSVYPSGSRISKPHRCSLVMPSGRCKATARPANSAARASGSGR
jgi:hypothetical protein